MASPLVLVGLHIDSAGPAPERRAKPSPPAEQNAPDEDDCTRLKRARHYLSKAMAAEALGVLGTIEQAADSRLAARGWPCAGPPSW